MLFNSYEFIFVFFPITIFIYFYLNHKRLIKLSKGFLVFSSLFFYSWWNIIYLPIILLSIVFNYAVGNIIAQRKLVKKTRFSTRSILIFGIVSNLLPLAYFKYTNFFIDNFNYFLFTKRIPNVDLALPLAISFFTFQQISYLIDCYRLETKEYDFLNFALFVTFFPQLLAGPIVHHKEMISQFAQARNKITNYKNIAMGLFIFSTGLFKKVVIADTFAIWADSGFDVATTLNLLEAWATSLSYTFQLYFDFSGYTDMAMGLGLFFNIKLPINFNSPYKATDIQDFWRRWHVTLSRFLRNYIYIPLGGNRNGEFSTYVNIFITFIIGGIWHGAGWNFIFWGFLHGLALATHKAWSKLKFKIWTCVAWLITFNFVNITWVFFRAKEWDDAVKVLYAMFNLDYIVLPEKLSTTLSFLNTYNIEFNTWAPHIGDNDWIAMWLIVGFIIILGFNNSVQRLDNFKMDYKTILFTAITFSASIASLDKVSEFLYFNF